MAGFRIRSWARVPLVAIVAISLFACGDDDDASSPPTSEDAQAPTSSETSAPTSSETSAPTSSETSPDDVAASIEQDTIDGYDAYWRFLATADVSVVEPFVDEALLKRYSENLVPDLEANGRFRAGFTHDVEVVIVEFDDSFARVGVCWISDQDLVQVADDGQERIITPAGEQQGTWTDKELSGGTWRSVVDTQVPMSATEIDENCG